jgi:hypothetical protein
VPVDVTRLCRGKDVTGQPIHYDNSADHSPTRTAIAASWHPDSRVAKCIARAGTLDNGLLGHLPRDNNPSQYRRTTNRTGRAILLRMKAQLPRERRFRTAGTRPSTAVRTVGYHCLSRTGVVL